MREERTQNQQKQRRGKKEGREKMEKEQPTKPNQTKRNELKISKHNASHHNNNNNNMMMMMIDTKPTKMKSHATYINGDLTARTAFIIFINIHRSVKLQRHVMHRKLETT